jgi:hypothetical protein
LQKISQKKIFKQILYNNKKERREIFLHNIKLKDGQRKWMTTLNKWKRPDLNDPGNLFDDEYPVVVAEGLPLLLPQLEPDSLHHVHVLTIGSTNHNSWSSVTFPEVSVTVTIIVLEHARLIWALSAVLRIRIRIRIRQICMFMGLLDPDPDPFVIAMYPDPDPAPDPSIIKQK